MELTYKKRFLMESKITLVTEERHVNEVVHNDVKYNRITIEVYEQKAANPNSSETMLDYDFSKKQKVSDEIVWSVEHSIIGHTLVLPELASKLESEFKNAHQIKHNMRSNSKKEAPIEAQNKVDDELTHKSISQKGTNGWATEQNDKQSKELL